MQKHILFGAMTVGLVVFLSGCQTVTPTPPPPAVFDPANATYSIEGQAVTLINGKAVQTLSGSTARISTLLFGQPVAGDVNGDGIADAAVLLGQDRGGSGAFYYVAAAINQQNIAQGTNAILLGDRIAPQTVEITNGQIIANYADRNPGEPMTTQPSLGVSKYLSYDGTVLKEAPRIVGAGERCGGNMMTAPVCGTGFHCAPDPNSHLPFGDVGGTCVAD